MKKSRFVFSLAAAVLSTSLWPGPALAQDTGHDHEHDKASTTSPERKSKPATTPAAESRTATSTDMMDMKAMCDMHRNMMSASSPADRKAMMDKAMKGMSKEQKRQRMQMMEEKCK